MPAVSELKGARIALAEWVGFDSKGCYVWFYAKLPGRYMVLPNGYAPSR